MKREQFNVRIDAGLIKRLRTEAFKENLTNDVVAAALLAFAFSTADKAQRSALYTKQKTK